MGFDADAAEDLVQDTFTTFFERLDSFEGCSQLRTWLFGILHRKALERRRASAFEERTDPIDAVFEARFDPRAAVGRLADKLWRTARAVLQRQFEFAVGNEILAAPAGPQSWMAERLRRLGEIGRSQVDRFGEVNPRALLRSRYMTGWKASEHPDTFSVKEGAIEREMVAPTG
jgi:hypothetical protein